MDGNLKHYRVIKELARGGCGQTFLVEDTLKPSRPVCVLKKFHPTTGTDVGSRQIIFERFEREAWILESLGSSSLQIPTLFAYFEEGGEYYLVQEFIQGKTLERKITEEGVFAEEACKGFLLSFLNVLEVVHAKDVIHRDIKPENIIIRESDNKPVLIDFGIVKESATLTVDQNGEPIPTIIIGTPGYASPEQVAGRPTFASDLYSLGMTTIYSLTGRTPRELRQLSNGDINWEMSRAISPQLASVVSRSVRIDLGSRYKSATEMLAALVDSTSGSSTSDTLLVSGASAAVETNSVQKSDEPTLISSEGVPSSAAMKPSRMPKELDRQRKMRYPRTILKVVTALVLMIGLVVFARSYHIITSEQTWKLISGASLGLLMLLLLLLMIGSEKIDEKIDEEIDEEVVAQIRKAVYFAFCLLAVGGTVGILMPTFFSLWGNYVIFPLFEVLILGLWFALDVRIKPPKNDDSAYHNISRWLKWEDQSRFFLSSKDGIIARKSGFFPKAFYLYNPKSAEIEREYVLRKFGKIFALAFLASAFSLITSYYLFQNTQLALKAFSSGNSDNLFILTCMFGALDLVLFNRGVFFLKEIPGRDYLQVRLELFERLLALISGVLTSLLLSLFVLGRLLSSTDQ